MRLWREKRMNDKENNNEGALTSEEIEKLLSGTSDIDFDSSDISQPISSDRDNEVKAETTILANLMSQAIYYQTIVFERTYGKEVTHSNVKAAIKDGNQIIQDIDGKKFIQMSLNYIEGLKGQNIIIVNSEDALKLVELSSGQMEIDLNENVIASFTELMVQLIRETNAYLSRRFQRPIATSSPRNEIAESASRLRISSGAQTVHISYNLNPEGLAPIKIHQIIDVQFAKELIRLSKSSKDAEGYSLVDSEQDERKKASITIRPVQYSNLERVANIVSQGNIGLLLDIDMEVSVELGRTKDQIRKVLGYSEGTIIELEKQAGEPVDILVNDHLIAKGEVMVMDDMFGVRITQILNTNERLDNLF
jgi:flagellar motor switch protein FliN/FliY